MALGGSHPGLDINRLEVLAHGGLAEQSPGDRGSASRPRLPSHRLMHPLPRPGSACCPLPGAHPVNEDPIGLAGPPRASSVGTEVVLDHLDYDTARAIADPEVG